jgi:transcriptional regulator GlxA family with amidase domain
MGTSNFQKYIKKLTGKSIFEIVFEQRLVKAHELLLENKLSINEIANVTGFKNSYYFSKKYKAHFGNLPSKTNKNYE